MKVWFNIVFLLPLVLRWTSTAMAQSGQNLTLGTSLGSNQTWLSPNGTFTMGFYAVPANSSSLYLGVWYSGVQIVPVWLLNRESPVKEGASLTLNAAGNLILSDANGTEVWVSGTENDGVTSGAFLENGNLVLQNGSGTTIWDSFDYPTDTFLPGMTVRVTNRFASWKSNSDPSAGLYIFHMVKSGELHFYWNDTFIYYNSGPWNGTYFENPPHLGLTTPPDKFYYSNSTGSPTFWYTTSGRSVTNDVSLKRFRLDSDGVARQHIWVIESNSWQTFISVPVEPCDTYRTCGQNTVCNNTLYNPICNCFPDFEPVSSVDWANRNYWLQGCYRTSAQQCTNGSTPDTFIPLADVTIEGESPQTYFNDTENACRERCIQNCRCSGYSFLATSGSPSNCSIQTTSLVMYNAQYANTSNGATPFSLRVSATPIQTSADHSGSTFSRAKLVVTVVVCAGALVAVVVGTAVWRLLIKRRARRHHSKDFSVMGLMRFSYKELVDATDNFRQQLGSGGFGAVHKGMLTDKSEVAVKTLGKLRQGEREFRTEVGVIGTIQHINLVRLRGFCAEGDHRALVYEYVPNGSLEKYLFSKLDSPRPVNVLDWKTRLNIALGAARGIAYLHHECRSNIIHCDIKPENILLEADFTPKVSDFGLAKLMGKDVSRVITNIRGTRGYLAPEWLSNCTLTSKVDVYSFGMTLLELVGGRRTVDLSYPSEKMFYAVWAFNQMSTGQELRSLIDDRLSKIDVDEVELQKVLRVGLWCTQDNPEMRPSMRDVVKMLDGTLEMKDAPSPPSYARTAKIVGSPPKNDENSQMDQLSYDYTESLSGR